MSATLGQTGTYRKKYHLALLLAAASAFTLCLSSHNAYAGFQWTPPKYKKVEQAAPAPDQDSMLPPPVEAAPIDSAEPEQAASGQMSAPGPLQSADQTAPMPVPPPSDTHLRVIVMDSANAPDSARKDNIIKKLQAGGDTAPQEMQHMDMQPTATSAAMKEPMKDDLASAPAEPTPSVSEKPADEATAPAASMAAAQDKAAPEAAAPQMAQSPSSYDNAIGFGSDIPLALALSQVVPPRYSFSFGEGVNSGYRVSWEGGKPWDQVVNDMIAPLKLHADIIGNVVAIRSIEETDAAQPTPATETQPQAQADGTPQNMVDLDEVQQQNTASMQKDVRGNIIDPGMAPSATETEKKAETQTAPAADPAIKTVTGIRMLN